MLDLLIDQLVCVELQILSGFLWHNEEFQAVNSRPMFLPTCIDIVCVDMSQENAKRYLGTDGWMNV